MIQRAAGPIERISWDVIDVRESQRLPDPRDQDAVVVSGSPALLEDDEPWMRRGMDYLRQLVAAQVPTLGICFGHQMLGEALGGRVGRNPRGREIGSVELEIVEPSALIEQEPPLYVNATHVDSVLELPAGAQVLARTRLEPHAAVQFTSTTWGVQFHPEMDAETIRCYIREREEALVAEGLDPVALDQGSQDATAGERVLGSFLAGCLS
jgi:GMP synthase (glutamine-hydrolysing)